MILLLLLVTGKVLRNFWADFEIPASLRFPIVRILLTRSRNTQFFQILYFKSQNFSFCTIRLLAKFW